MVISPKLLAVIRREYLQQVRTKAFWISTALIPALGLAFILFQVVLNKSLVAKGRIGVIDLSGRLYDSLVAEQRSSGDAGGFESEETPSKEKEKAKEAEKGDKDRLEQKRPTTMRLEFFRVEGTEADLPALRKKLNEQVQKDEIKAYIVLDRRTLEKGVAEWRAQSVKADLVTRESIERLLTRATTKERLKDRGVKPEVYDQARLPVNLDPHEAKEIESTEGAKNVGFNLAVSAIFFFLIYLSIFVYGAFIMRGVLEEKNNRIVEVIISSIRPTDLMLGKIVGIGLVGLTQYSIWAVLSVLVTLPAMAGVLGMTEAMPPIPLETLGAFVVFFLLGYFLYASLYAALAAPFNTEQEAQQFVMIPAMILVFASMTFFLSFNNPNGRLAQVLSFFPFTAPLLMWDPLESTCRHASLSIL